MRRPGLYGQRSWIYAARVAGRFQRIHRQLGWVLQLILFAVPWIKISGRPMLMMDLPGRRLYAFGAIFTPSDTIFVVLLGLFASFSLFFFTALFGRLWCGYFCPQTVFLEEWVRRIELAVEGDRGVRRARDGRPWTLDAKGWDKAWRKAVKWGSFAALSWVLSATLMSYFTGAERIWTGQASGFAYGLTFATAVVFFLDFAWFREQFCNYLCPYARFQGALTDEESLVVAYDVPRGEPRRELVKAAAKAGTPLEDPEGACISCDKCVVVCPQGIDIRDGFQLECINCARCVDACEGVMGKLGQPSLVTYTTIAAEQGRPPKALRPRTIAYGALLLGITLAFTVLLATRHSFDANVARAPGSLFTIDADGYVRNTYLVRVTNNDAEERDGPFSLQVEGLPGGAQIISTPVRIASSQSSTLPLVVRVPAGTDLPRTVDLHVVVESPWDRVVLSTNFKSDHTITPES